MSICKYYGHSRDYGGIPKHTGSKFPSTPERPRRSWCTHPANTTFRKSHKGAKEKDVTCEGNIEKCHFPEIWKEE